MSRASTPSPSLQHRANLKWDGLFCSNGPGDPSQCKETIKSLQWAISQDIPIFGICADSASKLNLNLTSS